LSLPVLVLSVKVFVSLENEKSGKNSDRQQERMFA
jgi:hypothetical protein